jgi:PAS domain S-box-containing protein
VPRTVPKPSALEAIERLFNHAPCGFHSVDREGTFLHINETELSWLGYTREELIGKKNVQELLAPHSLAVFHREFPRVKTEGAVQNVEVDFLRKDGALLPVLLNSTAITDPDGEFLMTCSVLYNLGQRVGLEESTLRITAERRLQRLLDAAPDAILEVDAEGRIVLLNRTAEKMFGYSSSELIGKSIETLVPVGSRMVHTRHRSGYAEHPRTRPMGIGMELRAQTKDGALVPVEISLSPLSTAAGTSVIAIIRDVTEHSRAQELLRRSEERLRQAEKLEALARLAGGTAHEFNNLLTMILGYAELLHPLAEGDRSADYVEKVRIAARRAATLTRELLAFGRRQVLMPQVLDLNVVVGETVNVLSRVIGEGVETSFIPATAPSWVRADCTQIEQIIANLVINAREAMPHGGKLTLSLENADLSQGDLRELPSLLPGSYVVLRVADTGVGMDPEIQARIFEPFFSTRQFGKAAGLGLATVYGIVNQSYGAVSVHSQPGAGSTFSVYLPRLAEEEIPSGTATHSLSSRGAETILLVEDQPHLLALSREFLERLNYTVLTASTGEHALQVARECNRAIHLLLTDVVMPGMNGRELALRLKQERPDLKILYVSGFADQAFAQRGSPEYGDCFLEKPFELEELAQKVRTILDAEVPGKR